MFNMCTFVVPYSMYPSQIIKMSPNFTLTRGHPSPHEGTGGGCHSGMRECKHPIESPLLLRTTFPPKIFTIVSLKLRITWPRGYQRPISAFSFQATILESSLQMQALILECCLLSLLTLQLAFKSQV